MIAARNPPSATQTASGMTQAGHPPDFRAATGTVKTEPAPPPPPAPSLVPSPNTARSAARRSGASRHTAPAAPWGRVASRTHPCVTSISRLNAASAGSVAQRRSSSAASKGDASPSTHATTRASSSGSRG